MRAQWNLDGTTAGMIAVAVAAPVLLRVDAPLFVRIPIVLLLVGMVPGLALTRLCSVADGPTIVVLAIALTLALDVAIALALLYLHAWSVLLGVSVLAGVTLIATAAQLVPRGAA